MLPKLDDYCEKCKNNIMEGVQEHHDECAYCSFDPITMIHPDRYIPKDGKTWGNNSPATGTNGITADKIETAFDFSYKQIADFDAVSHPSHYTEGRQYEPRKVIHDWGLNFNLGNAVKYISRAGRKGDALEDLKKARQYLDFEIEEMEKEENHE